MNIPSATRTNKACKETGMNILKNVIQVKIINVSQSWPLNFCGYDTIFCGTALCNNNIDTENQAGFWKG